MSDDLDELERLYNQATPGKWEHDKAVEWTKYQKSPFSDNGASIFVPHPTMTKNKVVDYMDETVVSGGHQDEQGGAVGVLKNADVDFICAVQNNLPRLLQELRASRKALAGIQAQAEFICEKSQDLPTAKNAARVILQEIQKVKA